MGRGSCSPDKWAGVRRVILLTFGPVHPSRSPGLVGVGPCRRNQVLPSSSPASLPRACWPPPDVILTRTPIAVRPAEKKRRPRRSPRAGLRPTPAAARHPRRRPPPAQAYRPTCWGRVPFRPPCLGSGPTPAPADRTLPREPRRPMGAKLHYIILCRRRRPLRYRRRMPCRRPLGQRPSLLPRSLRQRLLLRPRPMRVLPRRRRLLAARPSAPAAIGRRPRSNRRRRTSRRRPTRPAVTLITAWSPSSTAPIERRWRDRRRPRAFPAGGGGRLVRRSSRPVWPWRPGGPSTGGRG